jgi:hypothetical protein
MAELFEIMDDFELSAAMMTKTAESFETDDLKRSRTYYRIVFKHL